jgi:hypothetical protein
MGKLVWDFICTQYFTMFAPKIQYFYASIAQLVAHFTRNEGVAGSSPAGSSLSRPSVFGGLFFSFGRSDFCENALPMLFLLAQFEK